MKTIVFLLVAAMVLVGAAAAYEDYVTLNYQAIQTVDQEAGQNLYPFNAAGNTLPSSGAYYSGRTTPGFADDIKLNNQVTALSAPLLTTTSGDPNTHNVLVQGGSASTTAVAYDPEALGSVRFSGDANAYQQLTLSGLYQAASGTFVSTAELSIPGAFAAAPYTNSNILGVMTATPSVTATDGAKLIEPVLGGSVSVDTKTLQDGTTTVSGMSSSVAGFNAATLPTTATLGITTSTLGSAVFTSPATFAPLVPNGP